MKVVRISNKQAGGYVAHRAIFQGSNLFSERRGNAYVVYSYGYHFPLFVHVGGVWYENMDKYSASTSRQQSQARPRGCSTERRSTEELKRLIDAALLPATSGTADA